MSDARINHLGAVVALSLVGCSSYQGAASLSDAGTTDVPRRLDAPAKAPRDVVELDRTPGGSWCGLTFRACDPATQAGCAEGEGCVVDALRPPTAHCARASGRTEGARCGDGVGACDGGQLCILGRCLRPCCYGAGGDACGIGSSCAVLTEATFARGCVLRGECDYRTQTGCGAGDGCFPQSVLGEAEVRRVGGDRARKVDVRVVAATNRDLRREVNAGRFRADLFYRLAVIQMRMPSLRDRLDDLPLLVPALLDRVVERRRLPKRPAFDQSLLQLLARHAWPGNVRELSNYLEQYAILEILPPFEGDLAEALPADQLAHGLLGMPFRAAKDELLRRFESHYLGALLEETGGNASEAARRAGIDRVTVFRALRRLGIKGDPDPKP